MMKITEKSKKVAGQIETKISLIIQKYLTPEDIGFLTVSAIELSGDLQVCDVFVSSIGGPDRFLQPLQKQAKKIAHDLKVELGLKHKVELRFKEDKSVKHVEKMKKLME